MELVEEFNKINLNKLDQFYTKKYVAEKYYNVLEKKINLNNYDILLEPSAGTGSFYNLFPDKKRKGFDLEPKCKGVEKLDFFNFKPDKNKTYAVIGNPPFGKVSSMAIKFFNYSACFSDLIAFIIPRTFKRVSIQNKLNLNFHLLYSQDLDMKPCCFEPNMDAKCCFQIWIKKEEKKLYLKKRIKILNSYNLEKKIKINNQLLLKIQIL